jgi:hypothetical protein
MGSSSKRRQTMAKVARERELKERRERKRERRDEKKAAREAQTPGATPHAPEDVADGQ